MSILFLIAISYRYPTVEEILAHLPQPLEEGIVIDGSQEDIGLFKVAVKGREEGFIETAPQWVLPWKTYDWTLYEE